MAAKLRLLPVFLMCLPLATCGPSPVDQLQVVERWIGEGVRVFDPIQLERETVAFDWDFGSAAELTPWALEGFGGGARQLSRELYVPPGSAKGWLERRVELEAGTIDFIELEVDGGLRHFIELWFARPGEDFFYQRRMALQPVVGSKPHLYRATMKDHLAWNGRIERIALSIEPDPGNRLRLFALRGFRRQFDPGLARAASRIPLELTLAGETRGARLTLPGESFDRTTTLPRDALLEGAFGQLDATPSRFVLELVTESEEPRVLLDRSTAAAETSESTDPPGVENEAGGTAARWHSFAVDLAAWAGQRITLRFSVDGADPSNLAFWGDLRLLGTVSTPEPLPDVLLVVIDTLRADRLSLYGHSRPTSPRLDAWARESAVVFRNVVAPAPWTLPSHNSLFTGLDPLSHGQNSTHPLPGTATTLAEVLQEAGYETYAATGGGFLSADFGYAQGFDRYSSTQDGHRLEAGDLPGNLARIEDWLLRGRSRSTGEGGPGSLDRPRFAFLHTYEVHSPYHVRQPFYRQLTGEEGDPELLRRVVGTVKIEAGSTPGAALRMAFHVDDPEGGRRLVTPEELEQIRAAYDSGIAYVDHVLGDLLERLEANGRPTLVIVTSDHGEALGEHGLSDHAYLYDFNLMVPLLIAFPDAWGAGQIIDRQGRLIDIFPTVLDTLGLEPRDGIDGRSLRPLIAGQPGDFPRDAWSVTAKQGISVRADGRSKYIYNTSLYHRTDPLEAFFDLERDPGESINRALESSEEVANLRDRVQRRYFATLRGAVLKLSNGSDSPARFEMRCPRHLLLDEVKSFQPSNATVDFPRVGEMAVTLPPAGQITLALERLGPELDMAWSLTLGDRSCRYERPPDVTPAPTPPERWDGKCHPLPPSDTSHDGFEISLVFTGPGSEGSGDSPALSGEISDRLEALGYLD